MNKICIIAFILAGLVSAGFVLASTTSGTIDTAYKYAWGDECGWINFGASQGGVLITDSGLSGYAWSENFGWINLDPAGSGVSNNNEGTLSGYAWGENTGWINFSGVTINSSGVFSGTATGDIVGNVNFSCAAAGCPVTTDWRPASLRVTATVTTPRGSIVGGFAAPPTPPFSILINNASVYTNNAIVELALEGGQDAKKMMVSNSSDFADSVLEDYGTGKLWVLPPGDGEKTVYARFYTKYGMSLSQPVSSSIILKTLAPEIKIIYIKDKYSSDEDVIVSGESEANVEISFYLDQNYGSFKADDKGDWLITLGKLALGKHKLELTAHDFAGNYSKPLAVEFLVIVAAAPGPKLGPELGTAIGPILRQLEKGISFLIPKFFKPKEAPAPLPVVVVPQKPPMCMKGLFAILPPGPINKFVFAPLPKDIQMLAIKFPEIGKTFNEVGINKLTDVEKLKNTKLNLPGLTEIATEKNPELAVGKFALLRGIPLSNLTAAEKQKIPSEIVFAKTAGELVDLNVVLSLDQQGKAQQRIETIVGKPLKLIVKPDYPANNVKGYVIFKQKKPSPVSFAFPLNYIMASLMFAEPSLAKPQQEPVKKELVLLEFDYQYQGDGIYSADIASPLVDGEYEIRTVINYKNPSLSPEEIVMINVVDPEGYIFEKNGGQETRIAGAVVSLYWLNSETKQYELWPAKDFQQDDPQVTDIRGTYSFLVPNGYYYLTVAAPGYINYDGKPFEINQNSGVHFNIEMRTGYWWLKIIDWRNFLLIILFILVLFNFYRDRLRRKRI